MHRFHVPAEEITGNQIQLDRAESHHASSVLRIRPGEIVEVLDGEGGRYRCRTHSVERRSVSLLVEDVRKEAEPSFRIGLFQSVLKGKAMDLLIQKVTETGVTDTHPILSRHCVAKPSDAEKWRQITIEAAKQCGRSWLPRIHSISSLSDEVGSALYPLHLVGALQEGCRSIIEALPEQRPEGVAIWIGPEGDYSTAEMDALLEGGALPVTLGPHVQRAETAAISSTSILVNLLFSSSASA